MKTKFRNITLLNKKKLLLATTSLFSIGLIGFFAANINNNSNSLVEQTSSSLNATSNTSTRNTVTEDINNFTSYDLLASSNIVAPVTSSYGVVGWTTSQKTLTLTTFDGVLVWKLTFANNSEIINFYSQNYSNQDTSDIRVNNYVYLTSENILVVLLGTSSYTNQVAVGVNMATGTLFNPIASTNNTINHIVKVKDGINRLFVNSSNNVIGIKDGKYTDYVNGEYLTFSTSKGVSELSLTIPKSLSKNTEDTLYSYTTGSGGINFVTFISNDTVTPAPTPSVTGSVYHTFYTVAVDDYMNPILNSNNLTSIDSGYATNISNSSSSTIQNDDFWKYPTQALNSSSTSINFFLVLGGGKSSVVTFTYNISSKTFTKNKTLDVTEGEQAYAMYMYNSSTKRLFISNKKSKNHVATGYVDLNASSLAFTNLEFIQDSNWNSSTYIYTNIVREFPIISSSALSVPDPYIVLENGKTPIAKYFISSTEIQTYTLAFKSYSDPVTRFKNTYASELQKLPSQISTSNLTSSLVFTGGDFSPTVGIVSRTDDNQNGVLTFQYAVSYRNWYATGSAYTFHIAVTIDGFYAQSNFKFNFITGLTGDTTENNKWNQIVSLKTNKYAYEITTTDIINNFISYDIKDATGKTVSITSNMVTLSASASGYSLTVRINVTGTFPSGVTRSFSQTYDGFKTVSGYDSNFTSDPTTFDKSLIYPSELTKANFLDYFVTLGDKWSLNPNDWQFDITPDNLNGTAVVSLTYTGTDSTFPSTTSKKVVDSKTISSFKNIPSQFKDNISMTTYSGSLNPSQLWNEYVNNPADSKLLSYLNFPNINNKTSLEITCSNQATADNDGYLDLSISIKEGTQTTLFISGDGYFTYDSTAVTAFESILGSSSFSVRWTINKANTNFQWIGTNGQVITTQSSTYVVNLENQSYTGINKEMYADQVSEEDIDKLFSFDGYTIVNKSISPNVSQGTLTVIISLKQSNSVDSSIGATETKTIIINGFKVDTMDSTKYIFYAFMGVIGITIVTLGIFLTMFIIKKHKYKKIPRINQIKKIKR
ncbi:hypothetical protein D8X55_04620 [Malacoplasma penetrans]|uniref:lipoprotein 17-related variable surface protein n=1 Tax=Malacoplasma penetrans TaxID=28227 RepID=UPI001012B50B|nr:lipoprotein 17-related variable surface protein [Malacoplasma penetrans]RXY96135.1 hypothetical protein D8X55_04620 [Malacoplasma penetrans]